jgi:hypothetical protein
MHQLPEASGGKDSPFRDSNPGVNVTFTSRNFKMCYVEESELEGLASIGELNVAFLGICIGAFIALAIVLTTTPIDNPKIFASYVGATIIAFFGTIYFGIKTGKDIQAKNRKIKALKGEMQH